MFLLKGISILINLAFVPMLLNNLNEQRYGIWLTITTIISWFSLFDIGLGNGLRNRVTESLSNKDTELAQEYISTTYGTLIFFLIPLMLLLIILTPFVSWQTLFNTRTIPPGELVYLMSGIFVLIILQILFKTIQYILFAIQKPFGATLIITIGQLLAFISVAIYINISETVYLPYLGFIIAGAPVIIYIIASLFLFKKLPYLNPSYVKFNKRLITNVFGIGQKFFFIQLSSLVLFQSNNFILIQLCGDISVTQYNIAYKYLSLTYITFSIISTPFWSIATDLYSKKKYSQIISYIHKQKLFLWGLTAIGVIMIISSSIVYKIWLGSMQSDYILLCLLLLYFIIQMYWQLFGNIINGIGYVKIQFYIITTECIIYIPLAIVLTNIWGLYGAILSMIIVNSPNLIWPRVQLNHILNQTGSSIWKK
ncbi:MAG: hypothetical protein NC453_17040 [Muribaculum sp.]|nr:hypothetical protein [Muribaculum sp.]